MRQLTTIAVGALLRKPRVSWLIFASGLGLGILQTMFWYQPVYLKESGISLGHNSWIYAGLGLLASLFGGWASHCSWAISRRWFALGMFALQAFSLLMLAAIPGWWGLVFLAGLQVTRGLLRVVISGWMRLELHHAEHATVSSVRGAVFRIYFIVMTVMLSFFADRWTAQDAFFVLGMISMLWGAMLVLVCPRFNDSAS